MRRYEITESAADELNEILVFIANRDGAARAESVLERFLDAFDTLVASPGIGHHRQQVTGSELRWWPVFRYLVLYDPQAKPMTILRVLHSARDLDSVFRDAH